MTRDQALAVLEAARNGKPYSLAHIQRCEITAGVRKPAERVRVNGIRDLNALMERCKVDEATGCWAYGGAIGPEGLPRVALPPGVAGEGWVTMTGRKAGWLLAGRQVRKGHFVFPLPTCGSKTCCNPDHSKAGDRPAMMAATSRGKHRGDPLRSVINRRNCGKQAAPAEKVAEVQRLLDEGGLMRKTIAEMVGLHVDTVRRIARGTHLRQALVPVASVFSLGRAA